MEGGASVAYWTDVLPVGLDTRPVPAEVSSSRE